MIRLVKSILGALVSGLSGQTVQRHFWRLCLVLGTSTSDSTYDMGVYT